jgi:hypothetical protein
MPVESSTGTIPILRGECSPKKSSENDDIRAVMAGIVADKFDKPTRFAARYERFCVRGQAERWFFTSVFLVILMAIPIGWLSA